MDGDGPSSGRPRNLGVLEVSKNAFALDDSIEKLVRLPFSTPINQIADKHRLIPDYEVVGNSIPSIDEFLLPRTMDTDWSVPRFAKKLLKNVFTKKPKVQRNICKGCGVCVKVCPAEALSMQDKRPVFDYNQCIRCYCCQEMCPEGAIKT
jgi:ferredoxin